MVKYLFPENPGHGIRPDDNINLRQTVTEITFTRLSVTVRTSLYLLHVTIYILTGLFALLQIKDEENN